MPCKVLLDENLYRSDLAMADRTAKELAKWDIDAVYVGQPIPGRHKFCSPCPVWSDVFMRYVTTCNDARLDANKTAVTHGEKSKAIQEFKHCLSRAEEDASDDCTEHIGEGKKKKIIPHWPTCHLSGAPTLGTEDRDIQRWADDENRIIISRDKGRTLESTKMDRVALETPNNSPPPTSIDIMMRLKNLGLCGL